MRLSKLLIILLIVFLIIQSPMIQIQAGSLKSEDSWPILQGSFIQPDILENWSEEDWHQEFANIKSVKMDHVILQWSAHSKFKTTVFPSSIPGFEQETQSDLIQKLLEMGQRYGIDIYLGLQLNHDFFEEEGTDLTWLRQEATISNQLVEELYRNYGSHAAFKGWYLPFELDNWNFPSKNEWENLVGYYNQVTQLIDSYDPEKKVLVAPFFNPAGGLGLTEWKQMWTYLLSNCDIDIIALQDGVGVGHASAEQLPAWFEATKEAVLTSEKEIELWADTETFTQYNEPMPLSRMLTNMQKVSPYVDKFTSFSFIQYNSPLVTSQMYYDSYQRYVETGLID